MKRPFISRLSWMFDEFLIYMETSGTWNNTYNENLHYFDKYLSDKFPENNSINEEMLDWCHPRNTEHGNSCKVRSTVVRNFIRYARKRGWTNIGMFKELSNQPCNYIPHFFTEKELEEFFQQCDSYFIANYARCSSLNNLINKLEFPIYCRLLLSTGLRTCEARWLRREDVNFDTGVVEIKKSKGANEHRIVLHESTLDMLRSYDTAIEIVLPNRKYLFPDRKDKYHSAAWGGYYFRIIWSKVSDEKACGYDLRSMYAVKNITKWENHGFELSGKLLFLSRSMGHHKIQSTFGYFHLTPMLVEKLKSNTSKGFSELCPKPSCHEN